MGVTLYCFVFGVVSLRTAATVTVVLLLSSSSGSCVLPNLNLKPSLSFSPPSVSLHGRANPGPPPEDQDAAVGDPSTVGHLQAPPPIIPWRPLEALEGYSLPHPRLTRFLCLRQIQHLR